MGQKNSFSENKWTDYRESPEVGTWVEAILQGCDSGKLRKEDLLFANEDEGFKVDEHAKISNAWDILAWRKKDKQ